MRYNQYIFSLLACLVLCVGLGSCKRDKCKRVTCVNGNCIDGTCNCSTGYFTDDCSKVINASYDGTWTLKESCTAGTDEYKVSIAAVAGSQTQLHITGIWEKKDKPMVADFAADGYAFTIGRMGMGNVDIDGTGTVNEDLDEITIGYRVYFPGGTQAFDACNATLTKD